MQWLFEIFIDLLHLLIPWVDRHTDRSVVGESRMDRQARIIAWMVICIVVGGALTYFFVLNK